MASNIRFQDLGQLFGIPATRARRSTNNALEVGRNIDEMLMYKERKDAEKEAKLQADSEKDFRTKLANLILGDPSATPQEKMAAERYMNNGELNSLLSVQGQKSIDAERKKEAVEALKQKIETERTKAEELIKEANAKRDYKDKVFQSRIESIVRNMKLWNEELPETERASYDEDIKKISSYIGKQNEGATVEAIKTGSASLDEIADSAQHSAQNVEDARKAFIRQMEIDHVKMKNGKVNMDGLPEKTINAGKKAGVQFYSEAKERHDADVKKLKEEAEKRKDNSYARKGFLDEISKFKGSLSEEEALAIANEVFSGGK
jgi:hypothetical protein